MGAGRGITHNRSRGKSRDLEKRGKNGGNGVNVYVSESG